MAFCTSCGASLGGGEKFCGGCGAAFTPTVHTQSPPKATEQSEDVGALATRPISSSPLVPQCVSCGQGIAPGMSYCDTCYVRQMSSQPVTSVQSGHLAREATRAIAWGCGRVLKLVVGTTVLLTSLPLLFTPAFVGGILLAFIGVMLAKDAIEG